MSIPICLIKIMFITFVLVSSLALAFILFNEILEILCPSVLDYWKALKEEYKRKKHIKFIKNHKYLDARLSTVEWNIRDLDREILRLDEKIDKKKKR